MSRTDQVAPAAATIYSIRDLARRALVAFAITLLLSASGALRSTEFDLLDTLFRFNLHTDNSDLTVIEIDAASLRELDSWPWPRSYHAKLIDTLLAAGAARIAFDVDFSSRADPAHDRALAEALRRAPAGHVILPAFSQSVSNTGATAPQIWTQPLPAFSENTRLATINVIPDADGAVRRIPTRTGTLFGDNPPLSAALSDRRPVLPEYYPIDFSISADSFTRLSYAEVLAGNFPQHSVKGRKILIGATAAELGDRFTTPLHRSLPGVYLQALAYQSTYERPLTTLSRPIEYSLLLVLLCAYCAVIGQQTWRFQLVASLFVTGTVVLLVNSLFNEFRIVLPAASLLVGIALAQAITWLYNLDRQTLELIRQKVLLHKRTLTMRTIVESSMDGILAIDGEGRISDANPSAADMLGYKQATLRGSSVTDLLPAWQELLSQRHTDRASRQQTEARLQNGDSLPVELSFGISDSEQTENHLVFLRDITQQLAYERELEYRAGHDGLTGLVNRRSMDQQLAESIARAHANGSGMSFLLIDLNQFKEINDTLGHPTGDRVLLSIAGRMKEHCRGNCVVARFGGDEFGVLLESDADPDQFAAGLLDVIRRPLTLDEMTIEIGASIGISRYPDDAGDETSLVQHADVAMYLAKELDCGYRDYDSAADRHSLRRLAIIAQMRDAISSRQLYLLYQPKLSLKDGKLSGAEALIRWEHPELGAISPVEFIPIAEQTGMIGHITLWLMDEVISFIKTHLNHLQGRSIAINISARSLMDPLFPELVLSRIRRAGIDPARLSLEVTETAVIQEPDCALDVLNTLNDAGVAIEIDDFGTGYSSLSYLSRFPARRLKIDQSFIKDILTSETNRTIVSASIELAHRLGMQAVGEGVEDTQILTLLADMGCDYAQGYGISRPEPAADFIARLDKEIHGDLNLSESVCT